MTQFEKKTERYMRVMHFAEQLVFPGLFWYVVFFGIFKSFGVLNVHWWYVVVPFALILVFFVIFSMIGVVEVMEEQRRLKAEEFKAQETLHRTIFKKAEDLKREIEQSSGPVR